MLRKSCKLFCVSSYLGRVPSASGCNRVLPLVAESQRQVDAREVVETAGVTLLMLALSSEVAVLPLV
jgi:hypothetical protein